MAGQVLLPLPWRPEESTLSRTVVPPTRSRRKTSQVALVSAATRLVACEAKTT